MGLYSHTNTVFYTMILILKMAEKTRQGLLDSDSKSQTQKLLPIIGPEYKPMGLAPKER